MKNVIFSRKDDVVYKVIDNEAVILTVNDSVLHTLNEVGTFIWELLDGERDAESIASSLSEEFDVSFEQARDDVDRFLRELLRRDLLTVRKAS